MQFSLLVLVLGLLAVSVNAQVFGKHLLSKFHMAQGYVNLNHGSYGTTPLSVLEVQKQFIQQMEARPDVWFRLEDAGYRRIIQEARILLANYLNVTDPEDLTLVENASAGVNAVFRSMKFNKGDKILLTSIVYPMVRNIALYLAERDGVEIVEVPLVFPLTSNDDITGPVAAAIAEHGSSIKLASFSHIDSVPGIIMPVDDLITLCRSAGIRVLIDGAHAIGQIPVNLGQMDPDYYVANGHKWLYSPKGSAVFFVRKQHQYETTPNVISGEWYAGGYIPNFAYTGTRDYTPFAALEAALDFRQSLGGDEPIMHYMHNLTWWAGNYLARRWGTSLLVPENMVGAMIDVELPVATLNEGKALQTTILEKYDTYYHMHELQGKIYARVSGQVYLEDTDFSLFGERVLTTLETLNPKQ